jgi:hypothetical protein
MYVISLIIDGTVELSYSTNLTTLKLSNLLL